MNNAIPRQNRRFLKFIRSGAVAAALVCGVGCGDDIDPIPPDSGIDAGFDAGVIPDAFVPDGGFDGGIDAGIDAGPVVVVEGPMACLDAMQRPMGFEDLPMDSSFEGRVRSVSPDEVVVSILSGDQRFGWAGADPSGVLEVGSAIEVEVRRLGRGQEHTIRNEQFELTVATIPFPGQDQVEWDELEFTIGDSQCSRSEVVSECGRVGEHVLTSHGMFFDGRLVNAETSFSLQSSSYTAVRALREERPCSGLDTFVATRFRVLEAP